MEPIRGEVVMVGRRDEWERWPIWWSSIWVGALAAIVTALIIGLIAVAVGAHELGTSQRITRLSDIHLGTLIFSIVGTFVAFVVGGWVAGRIAGIRRAEPAMLHAAIAWLVAVPLLVILAALGAGNFFGSWYGGLAGAPAWVTPSTAVVDPNAALVARNEALGAVTALLLGLVGSIIGGWMASDEPMWLRRAQPSEDAIARRAA